ncbi:MAG: hypothetical protein ACP5HQ_07740 [Thermoprotei archaeon]
MSRPGLITVYEVRRGDYDFERHILGYKESDSMWREITSLWY